MTTIIAPRVHDIGGFQVHRAVPTLHARSVGQFVFVDHMGPAVFERDHGIDVRPHPHIGLVPGQSARLRAKTPLKAMLFGGAPLDGRRHLWWNFVSSSRERIEQAKQDWRDGRFGGVAGDDEAIPLPET